MKIIFNSIRVIDYINEKIHNINIPKTFNEYVVDLITHINSNENVRAYKTTSNSTEVISCVLNILSTISNENLSNEDCIIRKNDIIAQRLLRTEKEAQTRVSNMNINVKKGSLIQALIFDEFKNTYLYLLAKVEHSDFIDDYDFSFKTGFSKDKKTIWKSCLIDLCNPDADVFDVKVYSDTKAKYWSEKFLELEEVISDELNTVNAFKAIDNILSRNVKKDFKKDYTIIRNTFISYFKSNEHVDYKTMIDSVVGNYSPYELDETKFLNLKEKLYELPDKNKFDRQFNSVPNAINARMAKVYKVNTGIELKVKDGIPDLQDVIKAFQDTDGFRYLKIKITDKDTYECFK